MVQYCQWVGLASSQIRTYVLWRSFSINMYIATYPAITIIIVTGRLAVPTSIVSGENHNRYYQSNYGTVSQWKTKGQHRGRLFMDVVWLKPLPVLQFFCLVCPQWHSVHMLYVGMRQQALLLIRISGSRTSGLWRIDRCTDSCQTMHDHTTLNIYNNKVSTVVESSTSLSGERRHATSSS